MKDLRIDLFSGDMIIFAPDRSNRPSDIKRFTEEEEGCFEYDMKCPFCRGNEESTSENTFELKDESGWLCRSVYNKYPILDGDCSDINGNHEVMIDTYRHNGSFYNMRTKEFNNMFLMYRNRYKQYIKEKDVLYVSIFKNFLKNAGASLAHPHSQILSMSVIPKDVRNEINIVKEYYQNNNESLYKKIIEKEVRLNERVVYQGEKFIAIVPYASMYSNEVRVICKDSTKFENLKDKDLEELSYIFKNLFKNIYLYCGYMPFNVCMHSHPKGMDEEDLFNFHFHIVPRKYSFGGFELSNGMYVSSTMPKDFTQKIKFK